MTTTTRKPALTVGQTLWYVPRHGLPLSKTIKKIGRRWAVLDDDAYRPTRIDIHTMRTDDNGYSSSGQCYLSEDAYLERCRVLGAWRTLMDRLLRFEPPKGMTEADIHKVAELCSITLPFPAPRKP